MQVWKKIEKKQFSSIYVLYGTEQFLINETKQKLMANVLTEEEREFNLSTYDLTETSIETVIEDAETFPFFGERKLIIAQNPFFLTAEKSKSKVEHNVAALETYIGNPAPYTILVLAGNYEKLDERRKVTKALKKSSEYIAANKLTEQEIKVWIKEQSDYKGVVIDDDAVNQLLVLGGTDLMKLQNELDKLALYVAEERVIDIEIVNNLTARSLEQNIFTLVEKVVQRKLDQAFRIYYDLRKQNEEPIKILALITGQFRLIYQTKELQKRGYGQNQIATNLKVHPYRVKLALGQARYFTDQELEKIISLLAESDYQLKTGAVQRDVAMELFLLKLQHINQH